MNKMRNKIKSFICDENGMEFIQVVGIIIGAIALVGAVYILMQRVGNEIVTVGKELDLP